jgi:pyrroloquinoline-quinone synthase
MDLSRFDHVPLLPKAQQFRDYLDHATTQLGWSVAAAVSTLFLEGTAYERGELDASAPKRPLPALEEHPLVKHYGLPLDKLRLAKAHRAVEGEHRQAAWRVLLDFVPESEHAAVREALETCVALWLGYRDDVAFACGLVRDADGNVYLRNDA